MSSDGAGRPESRPQRLFIAIDIPHDVRAAVDHGVAPMRERFPRARWVPLENQHVTVKFLGATWPHVVDGVLQRVGDVASRHAPFASSVATLGAFPSARRARVLWVGLDDPDDRGTAIARSLDSALAPEFAPDGRAFTPHLTVARFDPPVPLDADLGTLAIESRPFEIAWLTLYRSHLGRQAPRYEALATFPLGAE